MKESLETYEKTIEKKHSFGWTPKFEEEFRTNLNEKVFIPIVEKTIENLGWDLILKMIKILKLKERKLISVLINGQRSYQLTSIMEKF